MRDIAEIIKKSAITLENISKKSQIPLVRLEQFMEGESPTLAELRKLAISLKLDFSHFVREGSSNPTTILFRDTMGDRFKPSHELTVEVLSNQLEQSLEMLSGGDKPRWLDFFSVENHDYGNAQKLAETFRQHFFDNDQVSPLLNLPQLVVENLNVILVIPPKLKIDGASAFINGNAFVFVAPRTFIPRMLFTLAHEVGHLLAHHQTLKNFAVFDTEDSTGGIRRRGEIKERFVDAFASCLLLPDVGVGIALKKIRQIYKISGNQLGDIELLYLAHIFGVSFQVAARRCEDLGLLGRGGAISLYEKICEDFGNPEKRARELNLPCRPEIEFPSVSPQLLVSAINSIRRGDISVGKAAKSLNISISSLINNHSRFLTSH